MPTIDQDLTAEADKEMDQRGAAMFEDRPADTAIEWGTWFDRGHFGDSEARLLLAKSVVLRSNRIDVIVDTILPMSAAVFSGVVIGFEPIEGMPRGNLAVGHTVVFTEANVFSAD